MLLIRTLIANILNVVGRNTRRLISAEDAMLGEISEIYLS